MSDEKDEQKVEKIDCYDGCCNQKYEDFWGCEDCCRHCKPYWEDGDKCKYYGGYCREYIECPMKKKYYKKYYGC